MRIANATAGATRPLAYNCSSLSSAASAHSPVPAVASDARNGQDVAAVPHRYVHHNESRHVAR